MGGIDGIIRKASSPRRANHRPRTGKPSARSLSRHPRTKSPAVVSSNGPSLSEPVNGSGTKIKDHQSSGEPEEAGLRFLSDRDGAVDSVVCHHFRRDSP